MVCHCRSKLIPVETERDLPMANPPNTLQARIKRLFLNGTLETTLKKGFEAVNPHLNMQEDRARGTNRISTVKSNTWE